MKLRARINDPASKTDHIKIYPKKVDGVSQLFARTEDGEVYQLTPPSSGSSYTPGALHVARNATPLTAYISWSAAQVVPTSGSTGVSADVIFNELVEPEEPTDLIFTAGADPFEIVRPGIWVLEAIWALHGSTNGTYRHGILIKNRGTSSMEHLNFDARSPNGAFHTSHNPRRSAGVRLVEGDKIGAQCFQDSGADLTIDIFWDSPILSARWVAP